MRVFSRRLIRGILVVSLAGSVIAGPEAFSQPRGRHGSRGVIERFREVKRFVVSVLHRLGGPPGDAAPAPADGGVEP